MKIAPLLTLLFGLATVLQSGLNRSLAPNFGYTGAGWINSVVIVLLSSLTLYLAKAQLLPEHPLFIQKGNWPMPPWWFFIPGTLGLFLVMGLPFSFMSLGAFPTILGMIAGQLIFGLMWDSWVDHKSIGAQQILGAILALSGVILVHFRGFKT